eukprot:1161770-Pelagomonas_calceolata.AAC.2
MCPEEALPTSIKEEEKHWLFEGAMFTCLYKSPLPQFRNRPYWSQGFLLRWELASMEGST